MAVFDTPAQALQSALQMHEVLAAIVVARQRTRRVHRAALAAAAGGGVARRGRRDGGRLLRRCRQRRSAPARPCRRQRDADHRAGADRPDARAEARCSAASTRWCCAAASSRCRCTCYGGRRSGDSAATQFGDVAPAAEPDAIRLEWLRAESRLRQPADAGGAGAQPAGALTASTIRACRARMRGSTGTAAASSSATSATTAPTCASPTARSSACAAAAACCTAAAPSAWAARRPTRRPPACASRCCASATPKPHAAGLIADRSRDAPALRRRRPHQPDALRERLCRAGRACECRTAASGAEALELAREHAPQLLVIDLHLPDTDGPALLQRAAPRGRRWPTCRPSCAARTTARRCARSRPTPASPAAGPSPWTATACAANSRRSALRRGLSRMQPRVAAAARCSCRPTSRSAPVKHGSAARVGVLLVNLGTPDAPTPAALRRYLAEFLSDPRVVEIPQAAVVADPARRDPARAAGQVGAEVRRHLDARGLAAGGVDRQAGQAAAAATWARPATAVLVRHAMRYGQPAHRRASWTHCAPKAPPACWCCRCTRSTRPPPRASVFDAVAAWAQRARWVPELRFVQQYHDDPGYIDALARAGARALAARRPRRACW